MDTTTKPHPILSVGRNCWRVERAGKAALVIDAEAYFKAVKEAVLQARHTVYLIGWDFDTRIKFEPEGKTLDGPNKLGPFLRWIDKTRPDVRVHVLKWNLGALQSLGRGTTPLAILDWMTSRRIRFKLDSAHPPGAAHHQKIIVVDDCLCFCGGIDMTTDRWDTREHRDDDKRRRRPSGRSYGPWHDASMVVSGPVAGALGDLARDRWQRATGETLEPPPHDDPIWPESIEPNFEDIEVAIARTSPGYTDDHEPVHEIEALYLDAIAAARRTIYCESQYFASRKIAEELAKRLREPHGPEVVIVNPESADGYLEAAVMDTARAKLLAMVHEADRHGRFRIYTPVTRRRRPIYVHAKILIVDDVLLRVGSSNLNNRSLGFDTECDLVMEAARQDASGGDFRGGVRSILHDLLAEHLDVEADTVATALEDTNGSLIRAIEGLISNGRSLAPYEPDEPAAIEEVLADCDLLDPERPPSFTRRMKRLVKLSWQPVR